MDGDYRPVAAIPIQIHIPRIIPHRVAADKRRQLRVVVAVADLVEARLGVVEVAGVERAVGGWGGGVRPRCAVDGRLAVGRVDVTLDHRARGQVERGRYVVVGVAGVVAGVVARVEEVAVAVGVVEADDRRVDVTRRPDVLVPGNRRPLAVDRLLVDQSASRL